MQLNTNYVVVPQKTTGLSPTWANEILHEVNRPQTFQRRLN